jgi:hypothetical protein
VLHSSKGTKLPCCIAAVIVAGTVVAVVPMATF